MNRRGFIGAIAAMGACPLCAKLTFASEEKGKDKPHWSYKGDTGPDRWGKMDKANSACSIGQQQSPVDLTGAVNAALPKIEAKWKAGGKIINNGHTIQVNTPDGGELTVGAKRYSLLQYHFHSPSEHLIDGRSLAMELHLVHKGSSNALGVIGIFLTPGKKNATFASVAAKFPKTEGPETDIGAVDPTGFLPTSLKYSAYEGSLTTPPCSEVVDWMVLREPLEVGQDDINAFTFLFPMNARPARPLDRRFILTSG